MTKLKEYRERAGLSQKAVAIALGVKPPSVSNWESGRTHPTLANLKKLADLYRVDVSVLVGEESVVDIGTSIPVLGRIPAGIPIEAIQDIMDWEDIPTEWTHGQKEYFALKVRGDSMYPEYIDGDTIILLNTSEFESGKDCAVLVNGDDATFKRVRKIPNGLVLQPLNPAYEPRIFTAEEVERLPVKIMGVVVEQRRKR